MLLSRLVSVVRKYLTTHSLPRRMRARQRPDRVWSIEVKRIFRQKRYKKVFGKKASERERHSWINYALCILFALIMHSFLSPENTLKPTYKTYLLIMSPFKWHVMSHDARGPNSTHLRHQSDVQPSYPLARLQNWLCVRIMTPGIELTTRTALQLVLDRSSFCDKKSYSAELRLDFMAR